MNGFDASILTWMNQFSHQSVFFDTVMHAFKSSDILKGGIYMALVWLAWFGKIGPLPERLRREYALAAVVAAVVAPLFSRVLAMALPFRPRPIQDQDFPFQLSYFMETEGLDNWNSFPSDHATLFFTVTACLFFISRRLGLAAFVYAFFLGMVRVYMGLHHPTDILGGLATGVGVALFLLWQPVRQLYAKPAFMIHDRYPGLFYMSMFLLTYEIEVLFKDVRHYIEHAARYLF